MSVHVRPGAALEGGPGRADMLRILLRKIPWSFRLKSARIASRFGFFLFFFYFFIFFYFFFFFFFFLDFFFFFFFFLGFLALRAQMRKISAKAEILAQNLTILREIFRQ